jgi:hypothetical protein
MEKCHKKSNTGATLTSGVALWGRNQTTWRVELFVGVGRHAGVERDPQGDIVDGFGFELGTDGEDVHGAPFERILICQRNWREKNLCRWCLHKFILQTNVF